MTRGDGGSSGSSGAGRSGASGLRVAVDGPEQTRTVAAVLAGRLVEGDAVLLSGDLAAGKTTFVTAAVAALGSDDVVTSPTFTIANTYRTPGAPVLHIDTYRLEGLAQFRDLGLDEYLETSIALVEWGELLAAEVADPLAVDIAIPDDRPEARIISMTSAAPRWATVLPALRDEIAERL